MRRTTAAMTFARVKPGGASAFFYGTSIECH